ncbi:MAG: hypothetical protein ACT4QF_08545 [Sporichthyaceae bacterium]
MTRTWAAGAVGLAVLAGTIGSDEPVADPRGTLRVCLDAPTRPGGYAVFADGPSGRGEHLAGGACVAWLVKPGAYRTGIVVEPEQALTGDTAACANKALRLTLTRPGLFDDDEAFALKRTHVTADQTTELRWKAGWCDSSHGPMLSSGPALGDRKPRIARAAAESRELEQTERSGPTGVLEICESAERESYPRIHLQADGPSARSAVLELTGLSGCLSFVVLEGRYEISAREGDHRDDRVDCFVASGGVAYVPAGETRRVNLEHECEYEEA